MSTNQHISTNLTHYIYSSNPQYAFLITGSWGAGKTHYIENYIEHNAPEAKKIIKVSLFGLSRTSEINERLFEQLHPILGSKYARLAGKLVKGAISFGVKLDLDSDNKPETALNTKLDKFDIFDFFNPAKSNDELILVLDDIERSSIPLKDILGYINELTDILNVKVILLINEAEIDEAQIDIYKKFKEKVIGKTFEVSHDIDEILDHLLEGLYETKKYKVEILDIHTKSKYKNIRKLKQCISDFEYLCEHINDEYLANSDFYSNLVKTFFALSIEAKAGAIIESDLRKNKPFRTLEKTDETSGKKDLKKLYFSEVQHLYSGDIWADIIFKCNLKNINNHTSGLLYFIEKTKIATAPWIKLWNFSSLEDEDFTVLIEDLKKEIEGLEECDLRAYIHKLSIAIYFSKNDLLNLQVSNIKALSEAYTNKYRDSAHWREIKLSGSVFFDGRGYSYLTENDKDFVEIKDSIINENSKSYEAGEVIRQQEASQTIAKFLRDSNIEDIYNVLIETHQITPILAQMSPNDFIDRLILATNADIKTISDTMHYRYRDNVYTNGLHNYVYLESECAFWRQSQELLATKIDTAHGLKKHILKLFLEHVIPKFISLLSNTPVSRT
ncbi:P-loop NTPase fold protein [Pseudomonas brassicacearum]|uniref:P-loop NTPase fold protein n=1 Tax=Pseudomonas brassicacearum TaxID=930166 RepID=UPI003D6C1D75